MKRILLLLASRENRELLSAELSVEHEVLCGTGPDDLERDFDLCLVDGPSLDGMVERMAERKGREGPLFLPVLLVTARPGVKLITRALWRCVDEVLVTPVEKPELRARVEVLLRARALSLALRARADEAEQAALARDEVLAMVSHDLRNPLNLVLTSAAFLSDTADALSEPQRAQLRMIHRAAEQMNRLIQDLLEVSGIEAGHLRVDAAPEAVEPLVREACALLEHVAGGKKISLHVALAPGLPPVLADRGRILQVFGNLVGNALKFTPEGGMVRIEAAPEEGVVRFSVTDSGPGIPHEHLPHVFDRFWQARRSAEGGAGLGLAIARGIVAAHGGRLSVDSVPGAGSTFAFTLPRAKP